MRRIAVITQGFSGSTFPLEKRLVQRNVCVDHYQIVYQQVNDLESFPLKFKSRRYGMIDVIESAAKEIYSFMNSERFSLKLINLPRPLVSIPVLRSIIRLLVYLILKKLCKTMNEKDYDEILFIGLYNDRNFPVILKSVKTKKIVALHEVCNHANPNYDTPSLLLTILCRDNIPIIVFSENSYNNILKYGMFSRENVYLMRFGLFEGYLLYKDDDTMNLPEEFILYIGSISAYKGLDVLYDAVCKRNDWPCKFVVAGNGSLESVNKMKKDSRFVVINRFLKNNEFAELIRKCKFVVCPYKSMSQSGIPQSVYVYDKPMIVSDLDGFKEIVDSDEGVMFESGNVNSLYDLINSMLTNEIKCEIARERIRRKFDNENSFYSWNCIADEYVRLFNSL